METRPGAAPDAYAAALLRIDLMDVLAARGDAAGALAEAELARPVVTGADADRLDAAVARALAHAGRLPEATGLAMDTLRRLRRGGDPVTRVDLLSALGTAQALRGSAGCARAALAEAVATAADAGLAARAAAARADLALAAARCGDLPDALALFAAAEPGLSGERLARCRLGRAETLLRAGLPAEARALLARTLAAAESGGHRAAVADGLLLLGHAELADGAPDAAAGTAERARAAFAAQGRTGWTRPAEHLLLRARYAAGDRSPLLLATARAVAARLDAGGWTTAAAQARVIAARVALRLGRPDAVPRGVPVRVGPAALRAASWHLVALERCGRGDAAGAREAVRAGLRILAAHADALGAHEPRAHTAGTGADLAALGLELAGTAADLLAGEERRRALARRPVAVRPPRDPARAAALAEIRTLSARQAAATAETAACPILERRLLRLEAALRAGALRRTPERTPAPPSLRALSAALDGRVLVELVRIGDGLHAVTVRDGRARRHVLGPYAAAARDAALLRTAVDHADAPPPSALLAPLRDVLGDRELVLAPTGALHGLPWAALPELAGRPFTVAPSAAAWLRAHRVARRAGRTVLAAGPGLDHAEDEITRVAAAYPDAERLTGATARAEAVRDALDGAAVAHVAAHGRFRPGNPLFSALRMADGPLLAHDLEDIASVPPLVVLSACDAGRSTGGEAVLGLPGVLLALGARTVIAPVTRVADAESPAFMAALHRALAAGTPPAWALARAPATPGTAGFLCFGAG
ncbi:CHAT domain protein [Actinomadura rubteroloni]|uniref:CHAT domain protein n=1 Tax=Actinomadura rubteroloni TaxID=1926885 RepID=A0A2P4UCG8_9ACTN|nr:CHAT domain-containing protein [Actinomadura rubteroloni]POM22740.1 CHAT domain protein [Actinomadura rubteroloni]